MENNITQPVKSEGNNNKNTKVIIIIAAIVVVIIGVTIFRNWQVKRQARAILGQGINFSEEMTKAIEKNIGTYGTLAEEYDEQKDETPQGYFNSAEEIYISDNDHKNLSNEVKAILKQVFGDVKITGFTSGYMGMNKGSGIVQFTTLKLLESNRANDLSKELASNGFTVVNTSQSNGSVAIMAKKGEYTYTFGYDKDEQEITVMIVKI